MMKRTAWTLSAVILALVMLLFAGQAEPAHADGLWLYEPETVDDTIVGWMITGYGGSTTNLVIPEKIDDIPVTIIGKRAFANDTSLTYLTIPATVKSIQAEAFAGCTGLKQVNYNASATLIPDVWIYDGNKGVGVFSGAGSAVDGGFKVVFGSSVTTVPAKLFDTASIGEYGVKGYDYAHVGAVEFASSVTSIGTAAFRNCDDLTSLTLGSGVTEIAARAFWSCGALEEITFSDPLHTIAGYAFQGCTALTDITWGTELAEISAYAFQGCTALKTLSLPNPLRTIGINAFADCSNLSNVTLNKSLNNLGASSFANCKKLAKLTINSAELTVPSIWIYDENRGIGVFSGAGSSVDEGFTVVFGSAVKYIPANLFDTASTTEYGMKGYDYAHVGAVQMSSSITEIGQVAFRNCHNLLELTLGSKVHTISSSAFQGCTGMVAFNACNALITIGESAFRGCTSLMDVTWGDSLDSIGAYAFADCTAMETLSVPAPTRTINHDAFNGCTGLRNVTLPTTLTDLCAQAFYNCRKLTKLTINCRELAVPAIWIYDENRGAGVFSGAGSAVEGGFTVVFGDKVQFVPANLFDTACLTDYGMKGYDYAHVGAVQMSDSIAYVGTVAFRSCRDLEEITLGSKVTKVENNAFWGCTSLKALNVSPLLQTIGDYAYANCTALTDVTWGDSLDSIGAYAFSGCTALETIAIPAPAVTLGANAFNGCTALANVTLPETLTNLCAQAFYKCSSLKQLNFNCISAAVPSIWTHDSTRGAGVFSGAGSTLKNGFTVVFGDKVQVIPANLFDTACLSGNGVKGYDFAHVGRVEMSASIQEVGTLAFRSCRKLSSVTLGSGVQTVGASAFQYCIGLTSLNLTNCMTLGDSAFRDCTLLSSINWGTKLDKIGAHAFRSCTSLAQVKLPSPLTNIGVAAFAHCTALKNVVLPESLSYLGGEAFYNAAALERLEVNSRSLTAAGVWTHASDRGAGVFSGAGSASGGFYAIFGPEVATIPANLFHTASLNSNGVKGYDYAHVTYAFIPANVSSIGENAFRNCKDMDRITFMHTTDNELTINAIAFQVDTATATTLHVPDADAMNAALTGYDWSGKLRTVTPASFGVRTMDMPTALTDIGAEAFLNSIPQSATLHEGVTAIGESAFAGSATLHLVHLPASLKDIPASAFTGSPWVVILCPEGSAAQSFAQANGIYYVTGQ